MTCDAMRERILEADLAELRGEAETDLARHIRECDDCQELAQKIVDSEAALGDALNSITPGVRRRAQTTRQWRLRPWAALVPLAAAAGLVAILVNRRSELPPTQMPSTVTQVASVPIVETTGDQDVAVFTTDDPDIVVVWFLGGTD